MASDKARAYTKSGSIEKFESNYFSGIVQTDGSNKSYYPYMTGPNDNGNYQIHYTNINYGDWGSCWTYYGPDWRTHGPNTVAKYFYNKIEKTNLTNGSISITGSTPAIQTYNGATAHTTLTISIPEKCKWTYEIPTNCTGGVTLLSISPSSGTSTTTSVTIYFEYQQSSGLSCFSLALTFIVLPNGSDSPYQGSGSITRTVCTSA